MSNSESAPESTTTSTSASEDVTITVTIPSGDVTGKGTSHCYVSYNIVTVVQPPGQAQPLQYRCVTQNKTNKHMRIQMPILVGVIANANAL